MKNAILIATALAAVSSPAFVGDTAGSVTYAKELRPWARSIREHVLTRNMPPWHIDKTVGIRHFANDRSLNDDQINLIVK